MTKPDTKPGTKPAPVPAAIRLPSPSTARRKKVLVSLTPDEHRALEVLAIERGEKRAKVARELMLAAMGMVR